LPKGSTERPMDSLSQRPTTCVIAPCWKAVRPATDEKLRIVNKDKQLLPTYERPQYWRSLEELHGSGLVTERDSAAELADAPGLDRRELGKDLGGSLPMAGGAAPPPPAPPEKQPRGGRTRRRSPGETLPLATPHGVEAPG